MKCPKCDYLGFETGDRCRNCGYDFSLLAVTDPPFDDLVLNEPEAPPVASPSLPLFARATAADDEPLIKVPAAPRAPLAVRRTPEVPRFRALSRPVRRPEFEPEPVLEFPAESREPLIADMAAAARQHHPPAPRETGPVGRRALAGIIDLAILFTIDVAVVYFTLRMASLTMNDWRVLPVLPLAAFLALLKLGYFCAFTAAGGQTIGKMAVRIQVVGDDNAVVDPARAVRRVAAGAISALTLGLGFIPALVDPERRAFHDRIAGTRVVARPS
jgi:uncharacterized RDD family membrane protein YckC